MNIGIRIIYDQDGEIIYRAGEIQDDVLPRKENTELHDMDLEYRVIDYRTHRIASIDPATKQPVLEDLPIVETPEQKKELEDKILLLANENTGGILQEY